MSDDERRRAMFELDERKIVECDVFLFVLDGRVPDEGACVGIGIVHATKKAMNERKLLVGLHTDSRAAFLGSRLNPMLRVPLERIADSEEGLLGVRSEKSAS
jgi:nucleoside 2-deoxyribosyltransferase